MLSQIQGHLSGHPWSDKIHYFPTIDSTNLYAARLAESGAPHGTIVIADRQTAGKGRMGRSFSSPAGMGVYLSCILRPHCRPNELMHLTCAAAVAAMEAVALSSGIRPGIKWTNDLVIGKRKLGGILTSLSIDPNSGLVSSAIIGIGINCRQQTEDFPEEIRSIACSLAMHGTTPDRSVLSAALIRQLETVSCNLWNQKEAILNTYKANCITIGQEISWQKGVEIYHGTAIDLDSDGGLVIRLPDEKKQTVAFGEVSIRGMYGYL